MFRIGLRRMTNDARKKGITKGSATRPTTLPTPTLAVHILGLIYLRLRIPMIVDMLLPHRSLRQGIEDTTTVA